MPRNGNCRCTGRCNVLSDAFVPSGLVGAILICRYCGVVCREPEQPAAPPARESPTGPPIFTIGYGGRTLEHFLKLLEAQHIELLLDVRRDARSSQLGFEQDTLRRGARGHHISYVHKPELGVAWEQREHLRATRDWKTFSAAYAVTLDGQEALLRRIAAYAQMHRLCVMCGERLPDWCHRRLLVERLAVLAGLAIQHL